MPFTSNPLSTTAPILTAVSAAITSLRAQAATIGVVNITKDEKGKNLSINDIREPYVKRMLTQHAVNVPSIVPSFINLSNSTTRLNNANYFRSVALQLRQLAEMYDDMSFNEDVPCYKDFRHIYATAKIGAANNLAGADAIVDDIAPLFEAQGNDDGIANPVVPANP
jgi:hypothetical protein